jgi:DNA-binding NarL/FixJ family response regulator
MRVMIAEDSGLLRQLLADILERHGYQVTGQASDSGWLLRMIAAEPPDVVILDIRLPPGHSDEGLRAARDIRASHPAVGILVLSHYAETSYAVRLLENGSRGIGYLVKDRVQDAGRLLDAVRRVASGETVIDADIVRRVMSRRRDPDPLDGLTGSERQVLALMAEGLSNTAIAERLFFSPKTVEKRATAITRKLGIPDIGYPGRSAVNVRVAAVLTYLRNSGLQAEGYPHYGHGLVVPRLSAGSRR